MDRRGITSLQSSSIIQRRATAGYIREWLDKGNGDTAYRYAVCPINAKHRSFLNLHPVYYDSVLPIPSQ